MQRSLPTTIYRRACNTCTASKRRCSKQIPACNRCAAKGIECIYPATRQNVEHFPEIIRDVREEISPIVPSATRLSIGIDFPMINSMELSHESLQDTTYDTNELIIHSQGAWFAAWDSWNIEHQTITHSPEYIGEDSLDAYIQIVRDWLQRWTSENSCPIIHQQLYLAKMPRCMQNAFMACTMYFNKTKSNQSTVFRIINDQASDLIQQNTAQILAPATLAPAEHLARVQALLILQIIRLFDGDIRMRARAEVDSPILASWSTEMWQQASSILPAADWTTIVPSESSASSTLWKAWCFSESMRRTWLTVSFLKCVYSTIRDGISVCPGGVSCTFGNELWDAPSDSEWERRTKSGKSLFFIQSLAIGNLLVDAAAADVDEFGHAVMLVSYGSERKRRWTVEERPLM